MDTIWWVALVAMVLLALVAAVVDGRGRSGRGPGGRGPGRSERSGRRRVDPASVAALGSGGAW
ncbi:hypothetical protein EQG64_11615 [Streptomyces sp. S6]|nr:hypothetical protein EQG64_11615 [Streptomyces sp. S6]